MLADGRIGEPGLKIHLGADFDDVTVGEAEEAVGGDGVFLQEREDGFGNGAHVAA